MSRYKISDFVMIGMTVYELTFHDAGYEITSPELSWCYKHANIGENLFGDYSIRLDPNDKITLLFYTKFDRLKFIMR